MKNPGDSGFTRPPDHTESREIIMLTKENAGGYVSASRRFRPLLVLVFVTSLLGSFTRSMSTSVKFSEHNTLVSSPGKYFEMGLFKSPTSYPEKSYWFLGIWHKKFRSKAVWVANRDDPLSSPIGTINISNSNLVLLGDKGLIWKTELYHQTNKDSSVVAELLDNGNFVIKDLHTFRILWQSFDYPTDTLLPGMVFNRSIIRSWKTSENPAMGKYTYRIYGQQGIILDLHVLMTRIFPSKILPSTTNTTLLRINENGVLQLLVWREKRDVDWTSLGDSCDRYNFCGVNSFCDIDINLEPVCNCIKGFEPTDSGDCVRKTRLTSCVGNEFWEMENMKLPDFAEKNHTNLELDECKERCNKDCNCKAFANMDTQNGNSTCMMWLLHNEFFDIRRHHNMDQGQKFYIKVSVEGNSMSATSIGLIVGGSLLFLIFTVFLLYKTRTMVCQRENPTMDTSITEDWQSHSQLIDFEVISQATNSFSDSNKIGEGGFGSVYKGRLLNGVEIAVKRLISMTPNGIENFDNEVRLIGLVQHINIIGFFSDENERILVYEHLENLGLDSYIFDTTRSSCLNWQKRFDIVIGIARGLLYLHQDSRFKIIHLDLKPSNILLGRDMIPKISDFGMAKTLARDETEAIATTASGTFGYMPQEYVSDKIFSVKSDVFSFGVLLLEILSGKRNNRFPALNDGESLLSYIWRTWSEGNGLEILDPAITYSSEYRPDEVLRCIQIGLLCVQDVAQDRPTIWVVLSMLGNDTVNIDRPKSPGSTSREHLNDEISYTGCRMSMSTLNGR